MLRDALAELYVTDGQYERALYEYVYTIPITTTNGNKERKGLIGEGPAIADQENVNIPITYLLDILDILVFGPL